MTEKLKFLLGRVENDEGIGEYAGYQHFLLFKRLHYQGRLKSRLCGKETNLHQCLIHYLFSLFVKHKI